MVAVAIAVIAVGGLTAVITVGKILGVLFDWRTACRCSECAGWDEYAAGVRTAEVERPRFVGRSWVGAAS